MILKKILRSGFFAKVEKRTFFEEKFSSVAFFHFFSGVSINSDKIL